MKTTFAPTFTATIYVGRREGYNGPLIPRGAVLEVISAYCNEAKLCVTVTDTLFLYLNGAEPGFAIGLINYPRFPASQEEIKIKALALAHKLLEACNQYRVSVVFPDETETILLDREG